MHRRIPFASAFRKAAVVLFVLFLSAAVQAQITPLGDSYTNSASPTTNYGAKTLLDVDGATQITYIQFNLASIPSGASVSQATLKLYVNAVTTAGSFNVDYVNGSWSEGTINWNNAPAPGSTIVSSVPVTTADKNQYILINITPAVQAWLNGSQANDGIALVANSTFNATFDSKENTGTSHPAELDVVFTGGTITGVETASGSGLTGGGTSGTLNLSLLTSCASNQILEWNGTAWACSNAGTGTITGVTAGTDLTGGGTSGNVTLNLNTSLVPQLAANNTFTGSQTINNNVTVTGTGIALYGDSTSAYGTGVNGVSTSGVGVYGYGSSSTGVCGVNGSAACLFGPYGVYGASASSSGYGVYGYNSNTSGGTGVYGTSASSSGYGVYGYNSNTSGGTGVYGASASTFGYGVYGVAGGEGVYGISSSGYGVFGNSASGTGVAGSSSSSYGVYATSSSSAGVAGVSGSGPGVDGYSSSGYGVVGSSGSGGGVYGFSDTNAGVYGLSSSDIGVLGNSDTSAGVEGVSASSSGYGVEGYNSAEGGIGVYGINDTNVGVYGLSTSGVGVYGSAALGYDAGYFNANVAVTGTLTKGGGSFKIDHPLDPANKYLYHSFVESPDMMNIYNGNVILDEKGTAWITLPDYFEALNRDFRYQLTAIGAPGPNLYIAQEIANNRFQIAGGTPGGKVSWQVTGIRHDAFANAHRIIPEVEKTGKERGKYRHPVENGQPGSMGIDYERRAKMRPPEPPKPPERAAHVAPPLLEPPRLEAPKLPQQPPAPQQPRVKPPVVPERVVVPEPTK